MKQSRVTLRDIADTVGTSISTVSLALRDDARVSEKLRRTIQSTAARTWVQSEPAGFHDALQYPARPRSCRKIRPGTTRTLHPPSG